MPDYQQSINDQYGQSDLCSIILNALQDAGKDVNSFTITVDDFRDLLGRLKFKEVVWKDVTALGVKVRREQQAAASTEGPAPLGQGVIVSSDLSKKMSNMQRNAEELWFLSELKCRKLLEASQMGVRASEKIATQPRIAPAGGNSADRCDARC